MQKLTLGSRMKQYEECYNIRIPRKWPLIIRIDGRAFHSWTKKNTLPASCLLPTHAAVQKTFAEVKGLAVIDGFLTKSSGYQFYNTSKFTFETLLADPELCAKYRKLLK